MGTVAWAMKEEIEIMENRKRKGSMTGEGELEAMFLAVVVVLVNVTWPLYVYIQGDVGWWKQLARRSREDLWTLKDLTMEKTQADREEGNRGSSIIDRR